MKHYGGGKRAHEVRMQDMGSQKEELPLPFVKESLLEHTKKVFIVSFKINIYQVRSLPLIRLVCCLYLNWDQMTNESKESPSWRLQTFCCAFANRGVLVVCANSINYHSQNSSSVLGTVNNFFASDDDVDFPTTVINPYTTNHTPIGLFNSIWHREEDKLMQNITKQSLK